MIKYVKEYSNGELVVLCIFINNRNDRPIHISKLKKIFENRIEPSEIGMILDHLSDICLVSGEWKTVDDKWYCNFTLDAAFSDMLMREFDVDETKELQDMFLVD